jgi:uncharacterized integral membrane protein
MLYRLFVIAVALFVVIAMFAFAYVNTAEVDVDYLFFDWRTSVSLAITTAFAAGWLFGVACASFWALGLARERRNLKQALRASESEVSNLRSLPMTDAD